VSRTTRSTSPRRGSCGTGSWSTSTSAFVHAADWMPTITKLAGWRPKQDPKFDGRDVWPVLAGEVADLGARPIYIPAKGGRVLLHGGWKLIERAAGRAELFDVVRDPARRRTWPPPSRSGSGRWGRCSARPARATCRRSLRT
jgi:hypothetical protein